MLLEAFHPRFFAHEAGLRMTGLVVVLSNAKDLVLRPWNQAQILRRCASQNDKTLLQNGKKAGDSLPRLAFTPVVYSPPQAVRSLPLPFTRTVRRITPSQRNMPSTANITSLLALTGFRTETVVGDVTLYSTASGFRLLRLRLS